MQNGYCILWKIYALLLKMVQRTKSINMYLSIINWMLLNLSRVPLPTLWCNKSFYSSTYKYYLYNIMRVYCISPAFFLSKNYPWPVSLLSKISFPLKSNSSGTWYSWRIAELKVTINGYNPVHNYFLEICVPSLWALFLNSSQKLK